MPSGSAGDAARFTLMRVAPAGSANLREGVHPCAPPAKPRSLLTVGKITIYRDKVGIWHMMPREGTVGVEAELADGYRIGEAIGGASTHLVFGRPGTLGMTADQAVRKGVLKTRVVRSKPPAR